MTPEEKELLELLEKSGTITIETDTVNANQFIEHRIGERTYICFYADTTPVWYERNEDYNVVGECGITHGLDDIEIGEVYINSPIFEDDLSNEFVNRAKNIIQTLFR